MTTKQILTPYNSAFARYLGFDAGDVPGGHGGETEAGDQDAETQNRHVQVPEENQGQKQFELIHFIQFCFVKMHSKHSI